MTEGKAVALECLVVARPTPEVTWLKDSQLLAEKDYYLAKFEEDTGKATLLIASASLFDTASYTCRCHNSVGDAETRCRVLVKRKYLNFMETHHIGELKNKITEKLLLHYSIILVDS